MLLFFIFFSIVGESSSDSNSSLARKEPHEDALPTSSKNNSIHYSKKILWNFIEIAN